MPGIPSGSATILGRAYLIPIPAHTVPIVLTHSSATSASALLYKPRRTRYHFVARIANAAHFCLYYIITSMNQKLCHLPISNQTFPHSYHSHLNLQDFMIFGSHWISSRKKNWIMEVQHEISGCQEKFINFFILFSFSSPKNIYTTRQRNSMTFRL